MSACIQEPPIDTPQDPSIDTPKYTVTWQNWDGTVLEVDAEVEEGTIPVYNGVTPTKEADVQYTYEFSGWDKAVTAVTGKTVYKAKFDAILNSYTVTWQNWDGNVLELDENVEYGKMPSYDGETPTKEGNAQYTYIFFGWNPSVDEVTGNVTYVAQFTSEVNKYTVTWINWDGAVLQMGEVEYGTMPTYAGSTPTKGGNAQYIYIFTGWTPSINIVTGDISYTAQFSTGVNKYTVTWQNWDGSVLELDESVEFGATPSFDGATPTRERDAQYTYTFSGWDPSVDEVTGNVTYVAQYSTEINKYTVTWQNWDGSVLELDESVEFGATPSYDGATPTKVGDVQYSFKFTGWDKEVVEVTEDVIYVAQFTSEVNKYTVTWQNWDGSVLELDENVEYGTMPTYDGATPTKEKNEVYLYEFSNWDKEVTIVTGNEIYTACFQEIIRTKFYITYNPNGGEGAFNSQTINVGETVTLSSDIPTLSNHRFVGWNNIYENKVYQAGDSFSLAKDVELWAMWESLCSTCEGQGVIETRQDCSNCMGGTIDTSYYYCNNHQKLYIDEVLRYCTTCENLVDKYSSNGKLYCDYCRSNTSTKAVCGYCSETVYLVGNRTECNSCAGKGYSSSFSDCVRCVEGVIPESAPELHEVDYNYVKLIATEGYEYSMDGISWQDSIVFEGLHSSTTYTFYQRVASKDNVPFGINSLPLTVTTPAAPQYTISYNLDGGTTSNPTSYTIESEDIILSEPTKVGYTFIGWILSDTDEPTKEVIIKTGSTGNRVYTAIWQANIYTITFVPNGGSIVEPITQPCDSPIEYPKSTMSEKSFVGWFDEQLQNEYHLDKMPSSDITVYAKWIDYEVSLFSKEINAISVYQEIKPEMFSASAVDTDGNEIIVSVKIISGTFAEENTIAVRLIATGLYDIYATKTISNIKVYGTPTLSFDNEKDFINVSDSINADLFSAVATDTYGNQLDVQISVKEENYKGGDFVTIIISAIDETGNEVSKEVPNVKVYGNPTIIKDDSVAEIKESDSITNELFGVKAFDSFGNELAVTTTISAGIQSGGNTIAIVSSAVDEKGNTNTIEYSIMVYGKPVIFDPTTLNFKVEDDITIQALGALGADSFGNSISNISLELVDGEQNAGNTLTYKVIAIDHLGNSTEKEIAGIAIYGVPTINYNTDLNSINYDIDEINAELFTLSAIDSFNNELIVNIELDRGELEGGKIVVFKFSATDCVGNCAEVFTDEIKLYSASDIKITCAKQASNIKLTSNGEEFGATAVNSFGETCQITIEAAEGYTLEGGKSISIYIVATDAMGNITKSSLIPNIKIYDMPILTYQRDADYIQAGDSPYDLFRVTDSFGNEVLFDVEIKSGSLDVNENIIYTITAKDKVKNELIVDYELPVLATDESILYFYINNELVDTKRIYTNELLNTEFLGYVCYIDDVAISDDKGNGLENWNFEPKGYKVICKLVEYTIEYELDGGTNSSLNPFEYSIKDSITLVAPTQTGHTFTGWTGTDLAEPTMIVVIEESTGNRSYVATWQAHTYNYTLETNGGEVSDESISIIYGQEPALPTPEKSGFTFGGWFIDVDFTIEFSAKTMPARNSTIYAWWKEETNPNDFSYYVGINNFVKINDYLGEHTSLVIPTHIGGVPVTTINEAAFADCDSLTSITIPDSVTTIGNYAFGYYHSTSLTDVYYTGDIAGWCGISFGNGYGNPMHYADNLYIDGKLVEGELVIPDNVTTIGSFAFSNCDSLTSVTIGNSVTAIGSGAFEHCNKLTSVTIGDGVTTIGSFAFSHCTSLTSIVIPDSVATIGSQAFFECTSLTSVTIGNSVTTIGSDAFWNCTRLTSVTIGESVTTIGNYAFEYCCRLVEVYNKSSLNITKGSSGNGYVGYYALAVYTSEYVSKVSTDANGYIIYNDGADKILVGYVGEQTDLIIPNGITQINRYAFFKCSNLISVTFGENSLLDAIGKYAFFECTSLTSVTFEDPKGWYATKTKGGTSSTGTWLNLTDPSNNAWYLTSTYQYCEYYWYEQW